MGTAAGIKHLRRLQIGRCGGLWGKALLAPDCCWCYHPKCPPLTFGMKSITRNVQVTNSRKNLDFYLKRGCEVFDERTIEYDGHRMGSWSLRKAL